MYGENYLRLVKLYEATTCVVFVIRNFEFYLFYIHQPFVFGPKLGKYCLEIVCGEQGGEI